MMKVVSDDRWENGAGSIVASKASFAHARAVVNDQCCYFIVTHVGAGRVWLLSLCHKKISQ
jgi:hypothetical protein